MNKPPCTPTTCGPTGCDTVPVNAVLSDDETLVQLAKAIAHPVRVRILQLLLAKKSCVCADIVDEIDLAQSTVSEHLRKLKEAGLIHGEIDGPRVCYCVHQPTLKRLKVLIASL